MLRLEYVRGAVFHPAALDLLRLVALPHQGRDVCFFFFFGKRGRPRASPQDIEFRELSESGCMVGVFVFMWEHVKNGSV